MNFLAELRKRNVFRVLAAYLVGSWIVMQVIGFVANAAELPAWMDSFVLIVVLLGLPIVGIAAWALELTPEGVKSTGSTEDTPVRPFGLVDGVLSGAVVIIVGLFAWQQFAAPVPQVVLVQADVEVAEEQGPEAASIAVLAFEDLSPEGDQEYFSDGISEELLNVLVRVDGLEVASRTSAFQFKGTDADIPEIAADLNVRHVVEGSVRRSGDTIRVTAQLIDSSNDRHLWSDTYDRDLSAQSVFEIQDEIASAIVRALSEELGTFLPEVEVDAATENLTAYELYLQARPIFLARQDLEEADGYLVRAVELDPEFSQAWEMRAAIQLLNSIGISGGQSEGPVPVEEARATAIEYADRALALNANSSLALTVITFLRHHIIPPPGESMVEMAILEGNFEGYGRALEIDPHNATALNWRGIVYRYVGYLENARADFARCIELEPIYAPCGANLTSVLAALGDDETAMEVALSSWNLGVSTPSSLGVMARLGHREAFLLRAATDFGIDLPWGENDVLYEMYRDPSGDFEHLIPAISEWAESEGWRDARFAAPDVMIGNYGAMPPYTFETWIPELAPYRASEEFQEWLGATALPEYWRANGFPPQCRERDDGWIECD